MAKADLEALARAVGVAGPRIVVFNPLPWTRDGLATVHVSPGISYRLKDAATGQPVACQQEAGVLWLLARDVPAMGYRTYVPVQSIPLAPREAGQSIPPAPREAESSRRSVTNTEDGSSRRSVTNTEDGSSRRSVTNTLENSLFRVRLDAARGVVASLVDKRSGRELVDPASEYALGQYVYERFDADQAAAYVKAYCRNLAPWVFQDFAKPGLPPAKDVPHVTASPGNFRLSVCRGDLWTVATMRAAAGKAVPHDVTLRVTLWADQPYVDIEWQVTGKKADPWPEGGWLCFPLKIDRPRFRLGRLGSVTDPATDIVRSGNFDTFCLNTGLTVTGSDSSGVGLCPIDSPLVSLGYPGLYRYSRTFEPRKPLVLVNLFANVYGTNFQQWIGGTWSSRVRLWPVAGKGLESDLITPAWEARKPLQAAILDAPAGELPPVQAGIELSRKGVLLTALGPNPDGGGTLLRLWEQAGEGGVCRVRLPAALRTSALQRCDLRGRPQGQPIAPRDGRHEIPLAPFAPASFLLKAPFACQSPARSNAASRPKSNRDRGLKLALSRYDLAITPLGAWKTSVHPVNHRRPSSISPSRSSSRPTVAGGRRRSGARCPAGYGSASASRRYRCLPRATAIQGTARVPVSLEAGAHRLPFQVPSNRASHFPSSTLTVYSTEYRGPVLRELPPASGKSFVTY